MISLYLLVADVYFCSTEYKYLSTSMGVTVWDGRRPPFTSTIYFQILRQVRRIRSMKAFHVIGELNPMQNTLS